ncbi:uncharacterized protein LOC113309294 [Papaver somniferum]|uniref:uncharacterized protein LOC113309294 n=1 Tax=Papaver somniferum TaxID=3469 RepID=UPI000E6FDC5B|nr:uncharacterized protein LOC113309294 [Papaver somniferum]
MATNTLSRMMKKAACSVILPLASRRTPRRNDTPAILFRQVFRTTSIPTHHHHQFSALAEKKSNSDDTFLRVIESEINDSAEHEVAELPRDFPFRIEDTSEEGIKLLLTREYEDEMIEVGVRRGLSADYVDMDASVYWFHQKKAD